MLSVSLSGVRRLGWVSVAMFVGTLFPRWIHGLGRCKERGPKTMGIYRFSGESGLELSLVPLNASPSAGTLGAEWVPGPVKTSPIDRQTRSG